MELDDPDLLLGHGLRQVVDDQVRPGAVVRHVAADRRLPGCGRLPGHHVHPVLHHFVLVEMSLNFFLLGPK